MCKNSFLALNIAVHPPDFPYCGDLPTRVEVALPINCPGGDPAQQVMCPQLISRKYCIRRSFWPVYSIKLLRHV